MSELNANSVEPDQTPRSAASDLVLHCLSMSLLWDARGKWAKTFAFYLQNNSVLYNVSANDKSADAQADVNL